MENISSPIGLEALKAALKTVPTLPGCYKMIDGQDKILYIGKAKNLVNRVTSYTNINNLNNRIMRMVAQIARVEIITTRNEAEALLLEASLVRRHMPRYNVLLKDDKSFPYIRVDTTHLFPRIEKHRGAQNKPGEYFGPFANVLALNAAMALLQKIFLLRPCADTIFKNRSRPCLQYQIKRCTAPCVGYVTEEQYGEQITKARDFLKGRGREVQDMLAVEMNAASEAMEYEKAALLRDRIRALTQVQQEQGLRIAGLKDADVIAMARAGDKSVVQVHFYRNGSHFGNQSFHPRHGAEESDSEVLSGFLGQFYQAHLPPPEILVTGGKWQVASDDEGVIPPPSGGRLGGGLVEGLSDNQPPPQPSPRGGGSDSPSFDIALLEEALSLRAEYKVEIRIPERGDKRALVEAAQKNAQAALERLEMERASVATHLLKLKELFGLRAMPARIEVYDNSHIGGTNAIGAFIVATPEGFDKKSYRTFNIKDATTEPGDDYAMMREVMRRRFKGVAHSDSLSLRSALRREPLAAGISDSEGGEAPPSTNDTLPDLVLIDGGLGQLHAVEAALKEIGVTGLNLVAIAKGVDRNAGREWFHLPNREPFQLPINDPTLHYLQRLRDEAHRYAIGKHRNKRSKSFTTSALDDIPGIGSTRKRALLQHFGSRADVETATLDELGKVKGISTATARAIYDYFHG
jgi:excinuclease ABC subunit C